jgi:nucleoside-diphosphate-sugar epimerase
MQKAEPGIVFHLASLFIVEHQPKDVAQLIQSNLLFSTQLLEAMKQIGVNHLVNTGTSWQHYWNEDYNPVNLYAATKQAFEDILRYYLETTELKVITLKLFDTYGPDDPRPKLMHLLKRIVDSEEILAMSPGKQLIDLVHIYDVVEAYLLAARRLLDGTEKKLHSYAVSSGSPLSLKELAHLVGETLGRELNIKWGGRSYRKREVMLPWNTGLSLPGWHPHTNLKEGVRSIFSE